MNRLARRHPRHVETRVEAPPELRRRDPSREECEAVERWPEPVRAKRRFEAHPALMLRAEPPAIGVPRKPALAPGEKDADLLEKLAHGRGAQAVGERAVVVVDRAARKDIRAGCEVGTARTVHQKHLPGIAAAH